MCGWREERRCVLVDTVPTRVKLCTRFQLPLSRQLWKSVQNLSSQLRHAVVAENHVEVKDWPLARLQSCARPSQMTGSTEGALAGSCPLFRSQTRALL